MSSRRGRVALWAVVLAVVLLVPASASAARYYLSLGDSLSQGMQPNASGITVNTDRGYADQLYAIERHRIPGLKLVKLGCGGETTTSFLTGKGNSADAFLLGCHPAGGSQMLAAERFLRRHSRAGEVPLATLDIGANDVDGCQQGDEIETNCVIAGVGRIARNLPVILRRLRRAAPTGTRLAAMTLYDPFLALYLTPAARSEALTSVQYARTVNQGLARLYGEAGFRIARVDKAFHTYATARTTALAGQSAPVPVAVAEVCRLTWMCAPAPLGPNIHANVLGYQVIAGAFLKAFG
jgi:lysophospholipase L1-like esterase